MCILIDTSGLWWDVSCVLVVCGLVAWRVLESTITLLDLSCVRRILWCVAGGVLRVVPGGLKLIHQ